MSKLREKLEQALRAESPTDCLTCIHEALALLEQADGMEPGESTRIARLLLITENFIHSAACLQKAGDMSQDEQVQKFFWLACDLIDYLNAKVMAEKACYEGQKNLATELAEEIDRLTRENNEFRTEIEWWGQLTRSNDIGTKDVPDLRTYILNLQAENKAQVELLRKVVKYGEEGLTIDEAFAAEIEQALKDEASA